MLGIPESERPAYQDSLSKVARHGSCSDDGTETGRQISSGYSRQDEVRARAILHRLIGLRGNTVAEARIANAIFGGISGSSPDPQRVNEYRDLITKVATDVGRDRAGGLTAGPNVFWAEHNQPGSRYDVNQQERAIMMQHVQNESNGIRPPVVAGRVAGPAQGASPQVAPVVTPNASVGPQSSAPGTIGTTPATPSGSAHTRGRGGIVRTAAGAGVNVVGAAAGPTAARGFRTVLTEALRSNRINQAQFDQLIQMEEPLSRAGSPEQRFMLGMSVARLAGITDVTDILKVAEFAAHPEQASPDDVGHLARLGRQVGARAMPGLLRRAGAVVSGFGAALQRHNVLTPTQIVALGGLFNQLASMRTPAAREAWLARFGTALNLTREQLVLLAHLARNPASITPAQWQQLRAVLATIASHGSRVITNAIAAARTGATLDVPSSRLVAGTSLDCNERFTDKVNALGNATGRRSTLTESFCGEVGRWRQNYYSSCNVRRHRHVHGRRGATEAEFNARKLACQCQYYVGGGNAYSRAFSESTARETNVSALFGGAIGSGDTCASYAGAWRASDRNSGTHANPVGTTLRPYRNGTSGAADVTQ